MNNIWPRTTTLLADRYLYVPAIGLYVLCAWALGRAGRWRGLALGAATVLLAVLCMLRTGDFRDSQHVWSANIEAVPESALAHIQRGVDLAGQSRFKPALADADTALELAPRPELMVRARLLRCAALYGIGDFEALREASNTAVNEARALATNELVREDPRKMEAQGQIFRGQALESFAERHAALDAYTRATKLDPKSWSAWFNLGTLLATSRDQEKQNTSIDALQTALGLAPDRLEVALQLATVFGRKGNKPRALRTLEAAEDRHGKHPDLLYTRATIILELGNDWAQARQILRDLREIDATHPKGKRLEADIEVAIGRAHLAKGRAERKSEFLRKAVDNFNEALRILPTHWQAHIFAGDAFAEQGLYAEARDRYRSARKDAPKQLWIAGMMARTASLEAALATRRAERQADIRAAAQIMAAAVTLDVARIDLGFAPLQEELPLLREVAAVLERAQVPEADFAASILGIAALLVTGDELTALTDLRTVFEQLGGSERSAVLIDAALVLRAILYERQTDFDLARADFELLRSRRPDDILPQLRLLQIDLRVAEARRITAASVDPGSPRAVEAMRAVEAAALKAREFADAHPESSAAGLLAVQADINLERWIPSVRRLLALEQRFKHNPTVYRGFNAVYVAWYTKTREKIHMTEADRALRKAMDLDPRDVRTLMDASQLARVAGNLQSALKNAQSARDMESYAGGPASRMLSDLQIELGKQALQGGQHESVKAAIKAARRAAPRRAGSWVLEGELALKSPSKDRLQRAYKLATRAKELEPYDPDVNNLLARTHAAMATVAQFRMAAVRLPPPGTPARKKFDALPKEEQAKQRELVAARREQYRLRAIEDFRLAVLLDPTAESADDWKRQVARLEESSSTTQHELAQKAQKEYEAGKAFRGEGEHVRAFYAFLRAVRIYPRLARAHGALVQAAITVLPDLPMDKEEGRTAATKYLDLAHRSLVVLESLDVDRRTPELYYLRGRLNMWDWLNKPAEHADAKEVAALAAMAAFEHFIVRYKALGKTPETDENMRDALARLKVLRGDAK